MNKNLGPQILELLNQGFTKQEIAKKLNCSSSLICYHTSKGQKEKSNTRGRRYRKSNPISHKYSFFIKNKLIKEKQEHSKSKIKQIIKVKLQHYSKDKESSVIKQQFSVNDLLNKIGDNPKCYLTGRNINLAESRSYNLDHIIPRSKGGDNSIDNCGLACRDANQAKNDMLLEDFYKLCEEILENKNNQ